MTSEVLGPGSVLLRRDIIFMFECNELCLHLYLLRDFMRDRDFPVYELTYVPLVL